MNKMQRCWRPVYEDSDGQNQSGGQSGNNNVPSVDKKFSQEDVNSMIAKARSEDKERVKKLASQLEELREKSTLTEKEKNELTTQIEELRTQVMTKEELAAREKKKLEEQFKREKEDAENQAKTWRSRYESSTVARSLMDSAVQNDAFNPQQIVAMLQPMARVVELTDDDGKPKGEFQVRVKFFDKDDKGNQVVLDLTPSDVIKRMKDSPELYGNLFKAGVKTGLGGSNTSGSATIDPRKITAENYPQIRKQLKQEGKL